MSLASFDFIVQDDEPSSSDTTVIERIIDGILNHGGKFQQNELTFSNSSESSEIVNKRKIQSNSDDGTSSSPAVPKSSRGTRDDDISSETTIKKQRITRSTRFNKRNEIDIDILSNDFEKIEGTNGCSVINFDQFTPAKQNNITKYIEILNICYDFKFDNDELILFAHNFTNYSRNNSSAKTARYVILEFHCVKLEPIRCLPRTILNETLLNNFYENYPKLALLKIDINDFYKNRKSDASDLIKWIISVVVISNEYSVYNLQLADFYIYQPSVTETCLTECRIQKIKIC